MTGKNIFAPTYTSPTPSKMTTAVSDMQTAFNDAATRVNPDFTELYDGHLEGKTLVPGLYKWGTSVDFTSSVIFSGTATDVWILQIVGSVEVGSGAIDCHPRG